MVILIKTGEAFEKGHCHVIVFMHFCGFAKLLHPIECEEEGCINIPLRRNNLHHRP
jgi:hypothetical protein